MILETALNLLLLLVMIGVVTFTAKKKRRLASAVGVVGLCFLVALLVLDLIVRPEAALLCLAILAVVWILRLGAH